MPRFLFEIKRDLRKAMYLSNQKDMMVSLVFHTNELVAGSLLKS